MPDAAESPRPLLLVVATVHLDSQWRWTIQDTIRDFIPRTLEENFALFVSHPGYQLSFEGAFRYMLAQEYYPEQFEELKRWVAAGRWHPVGGMLDAPDVNIAAPESLIRHILYGNRFFERELGRRSRDVFLPDCFGFGHALPTIAAHCGLESFSSSKLIKWKTPDTIPFEIARWRGPDGSEIVAAIQPGGYGEGIDEDLSSSPEWRRRLGGDVRLGVRYVGTGDRGGSPDRPSLDRLEAAIAAEGPIHVHCAASDALTDLLSPAERERLEVWDDELLLPTHGTGCWTAQAALKRWNRGNEHLGDAAERAALAADWLGAVDYPHERLRQAWLRFLWHQMHDDLTGTSIPEAYRFTWNDEAVAANLFAGVLTDSIAGIARQLDTDTPGTPLVVFNPSGHPRRDVVEATLATEAIPPLPVDVRDPAGRVVPSQVEELEDGRVRLLFPATVEPVSASVFEVIERSPSAAAPKTDLRADRRTLENARYRVEVDRHGDLSSLFDKRLGRPLLDQPVGYELLRNRSMRWPAWEIRPETLLGRRRPLRVGGPATIRLVESGPVRATLEIERQALGSSFRQLVRLEADGERVEIDHRIDWATRGRLLKASFPLAATHPEAVYDLGVGTIRRGNNRRERYEVPAQRWAAILDSGGGFGVAVLNDSKYGWDKPADNELRLSLLHSPTSLRKYPHQRTQDFGYQRFKLAVCGIAGGGEPQFVDQQAESLNRPLQAFVVPAAEGPLGRTVSLLRISEPGLAVQALKKAEDADRWIARLRQTAGAAVPRARLTPRADLLDAEETDGCERPLGALETDGNAVLFDSRPSALTTISMRVAPAPVAAPPLETVHLELPHDLRAASLHGGEPADFDGRGHSLPGELLPRRLAMGQVTFDLAAPDAAGAVACRGQVLDLPRGAGGRLWLLAAAIEGPQEAAFGVGDSECRLSIADWSGWLAERERPARWGGVVPYRSASLVRDDLAWVGTHRHRLRGDHLEDEPYVFCYLFRYALDVEPDAVTLRLPRNDRIRLFAATLVGGPATWAYPAGKLYG